MFSDTDASSPVTPALIKLIGVVEEENAVLRENQFTFHAGYTDRKNQALRELMAIQRQEALPALAKRARPLLQELARKLEENARLLRLNIAAAGEVCDIIVGSLKEAESDGTYSRSKPTAIR